MCCAFSFIILYFCLLLGCTDSLRLFTFRIEETPYDPTHYCLQQTAPQREARDRYNPFLVALYPINEHPAAISCCNKEKETRPDPALVRGL